jgi:hypothetical protein
MQIGKFTRQSADHCYLPDRNTESTGSGNYKLSTDQIHNCQKCLSTLGPRSNVMGHGVSTNKQTGPAESQDLVDTESLLSNRNVKNSRCKKGGVNPVNLSNLPLYDTHVCNDVLNPQSTKLSHPPSNYRDTAINRFYNLHHNAQANIYQPFAINTHLESIDNHHVVIPKPWGNRDLPREQPGKPKKCGMVCKN